MEAVKTGEEILMPEAQPGQKPGGNVKERIKALKNRLRWSIPPQESLDLYSHVHEQIGNVEYLVGPDLAQGKWLSDTPESCARQFLLEKSELFGLPRMEFELQLFRKHVLHSRLGTHCIFGLRYEGKEVEEHSFSVHLDHDNRVVMVASVYHSDTPEMVLKLSKEIEETGVDPFSQELLNQKLKEFNLLTAKEIRVEPMWVPWYDEKQQYELRSGWQIKCVSDKDSFVVWVVRDKAGNIKNGEPYPVSAKVGQEWVGLGEVFQDFWELENEGEPVPVFDVFSRATRPVILRDLKSHNELLGRYVRVRDIIEIEEIKLPSTETPFNFCHGPDLAMSHFDRVMAYYHLDLIQRFFRELGLDILDDDAYPQFSPMEVILGGTASRYCTSQQRIYFQRRTGSYHCSDAREARIVYHEFVHAVTDALARMHRQDTRDTNSPRYRQILEAEAMDEGLADYFACSLAERYGMKHARFYTLKDVSSPDFEDDFFSKSFRNLECAIDADTECKEDDGPEGIIYSWGERWSRYLWGLNCKLGAEVADMIIAHSIFFLTRWATFGMGILAIMLADRLLFGGVHKDEILKAPKKWSDWDR